MSSSDTSSVPTESAASPHTWQAGTLVYDRKGIVKLMFWLIFGHFTNGIELVAIPAILPLMLKLKGFSALEIGSLLAVMPLGSLFVGPVLGTWSDRLRTRWGRRRPICLALLPVWTLGLVLIPFLQSYNAIFCALLLVSAAGASSALNHSFDNDVVPPALMGRFTAIISLLWGVGVLVFQLLALRHFDDAPNATFLTLAAVGLVGPALMLGMVKEGQYPAPEYHKSAFDGFRHFIKEGFANRYIIFLWLTLGLTGFGGPVMSNYFNLFLTDSMKMSSTEIGQLLAIGTVVGMTLVLPAGWLIDAIGPKKIWLFGGLCVGLVQVGLFVAHTNRTAIYGLYVAYAVFNTLLSASLMPVLYSFIPQAKFGQLMGANSIVTRLFQIVGTAVCGLLITATHDNYRFAFAFGALGYLLSPLFFYLMLKQKYPYTGLTTTMHPDGKRGLLKQQAEEAAAAVAKK